jgi:hypothetical protein
LRNFFFFSCFRRTLRCDTGFGKSCLGSMTCLLRRSSNMSRGDPAK